MARKEKLTLELKLTVTYSPNGVSKEELISNLDRIVAVGMGDGFLTLDTPAEVDTHSVNITTIPQPVKVKKPKSRFHTGTTVFAHNKVSYFYQLPSRKRITKDELFQMEEAAEERAMECISDGCIQGELNYETDKFQATGWWKIEE